MNPSQKYKLIDLFFSPRVLILISVKKPSEFDLIITNITNLDNNIN